MRAVVLVGGFGTRLRPLTLHVPKQMLPVGGVTMLERVVAKLGRAGVDEVILSLGYRPDVFLEAFPDGTCAGVKLSYMQEPEPLDTGGAIAFAARGAGVNETFLALNGDVLSDIDFDELVRTHRRFGAEATIALTPVEDPSGYGVVVTDTAGRVTDFVEKPAREDAPSNWINAGCYVLEPSVLDLIPAGEKVSVERSTFPKLVARQGLFAVPCEGYWLDAGTPETYLDANVDLTTGRGGTTEPGVHVTARVAPDARVDQSVVLADAVIEAGATVERSVVMQGAHVKANAVVRDSIIGMRSTIGVDARVVSLCVIGHDQHIPDAADLAGVRQPGPEEWT
jgi:mannose-1-phosphate guanylyltransferase